MERKAVLMRRRLVTETFRARPFGGNMLRLSVIIRVSTAYHAGYSLVGAIEKEKKLHLCPF